MSELVAQPIGDDARDDVDRAARAEADHDLDRPHRIFLREGLRRHAQSGDDRQQAKRSLHSFSPQKFSPLLQVAAHSRIMMSGRAGFRNRVCRPAFRRAAGRSRFETKNAKTTPCTVADACEIKDLHERGFARTRIARFAIFV
ncbi:hypothetical protein [Bradyrhizobium sp. 151]|uniref:hypothetical protein n=1 Tax=Bradyrhizobium sp. 151 TaxID=2782626 RepID=UPI001FFB2A8D|nr:hypothetical protein [Bradyrhizobium sp. 151]